MAAHQGLVVAVVGAPRAGATTLVRSLGAALVDSYVSYPAAGDEGATGHWEQRLRQLFRAQMAALKDAAIGKGSIIDGCFGSVLARIQIELNHSRLSSVEAATLFEFAKELQRRCPPPDVVVHLQTTPAGLDARARKDESLALEDHQLLDSQVREAVQALVSQGEPTTEVFRRKWDTFGKTAAVRPCAQRDRGHRTHLAPSDPRTPRPRIQRPPVTRLLGRTMPTCRRCATLSSARHHPCAVPRRERHHRALLSIDC